MTSKEAITKLNVLSSYETSKEKREEYKECINTILKDLEVLETFKNIEEELGIDLLTLFKALKNGIWIRKSYFYGTCDLEGKPIFINSHCLHLGIYDCYNEKTKEGGYSKCETALCFYNMAYEEIDNIAKVKDYGKTWSLDKQTLNKGEQI